MFFKEYEKTLSKETQTGMLRSNFYHEQGKEGFLILSLFACARVCVSHAKRIDWACEILTNSSLSSSSNNTKKKQKKNETMTSIQTTTKMMLGRIREILLGDDEYYEEDDDSDDEEDDDATIKLDPMELAMAKDEREARRAKSLDEDDEEEEGEEEEEKSWRWLERLDDIDRRFDFFTETSPNATNKEEIEEIVLLFRIQLAKFIEAVAILGDENEAKEQHELVNSLDQLLGGTTYSILADNARRWSTYLYAYATPTVAALKALKRVGEKNEWLEIGAGKGVWARAMRRFGIHITATDAMPEDGNDYHLIEQESSNERNRSIVQKMTHLEAIKKYNHRANGLLVCYCPPDSNMASTSLRAFKGEYVAVIGEDVMNTGDVEMFRILNERFKVLKRVYLPQWMDTEHHLRFLPPVKMCGDELYETVAL
ncbi:unnamed protein product [Bathycoccus prasinos]